LHLRFDNNDNMVLYRDFPPGLDPAGTWAVEGFVSLDTVNILSQGAQNANIGIIDMAEFGNTGAVEFYTGMRNDGAPYSIGFESSINAFNVRRRSPTLGARARAARRALSPRPLLAPPSLATPRAAVLQNWYSTSSTSNNFNGAFAAYVRIERDAPRNIWTSFFKFNFADPWVRQPIIARDAQLRGGAILPANVRPALVTRNWNGGARAVSLFTYLRIGPLSCTESGTVRYVTGAASSALIYGLTRGTQYSFVVSALTPAGWGSPSNPSPPITTLNAASLTFSTFRLVSQGRPCVSFPVYDQVPCSRGFDGDAGSWTSTERWAVTPLNIGTAGGGGGWIQVDLGTSFLIDSITLVGRQDCCQARINNFNIRVGDETQWDRDYWAYNQDNNQWYPRFDNLCSRGLTGVSAPLLMSTLANGAGGAATATAPYNAAATGFRNSALGGGVNTN